MTRSASHRTDLATPDHVALGIEAYALHISTIFDPIGPRDVQGWVRSPRMPYAQYVGTCLDSDGAATLQALETRVLAHADNIAAELAPSLSTDLRLNYRSTGGALAIRAGDQLLTTAPDESAADALATDLLVTIASIRQTLHRLLNGVHMDPDSGLLVAYHHGQIVATGGQDAYRNLLVALSDARIRDLRRLDEPAALPTYEQLQAAERAGTLADELAALSRAQLERLTQAYIRERRIRHGVQIAFPTAYARFRALVRQRAA
jgi:hypothetical protein